MANPTDQVLAIISAISERPATELRPEMGLVADLAIDSPKALRLLIELEDAFGVEIGDEDAGLMDTVGDVLRYFDRHPPA